MSVEDMLDAIKSQLENHEKRIAYLETRPDDKRETTTKKLSIREFFISKKPKTDVPGSSQWIFRRPPQK